MWNVVERRRTDFHSSKCVLKIDENQNLVLPFLYQRLRFTRPIWSKLTQKRYTIFPVQVCGNTFANFNCRCFAVLHKGARAFIFHHTAPRQYTHTQSPRAAIVRSNTTVERTSLWQHLYGAFVSVYNIYIIVWLVVVVVVCVVHESITAAKTINLHFTAR